MMSKKVAYLLLDVLSSSYSVRRTRRLPSQAEDLVEDRAVGRMEKEDRF
jgi:hypothetical protein